MSQHLSLDASTFEGLLAAVWVLQRHHEQEDRVHRPAANAIEGEPPETDLDSGDISERDTTNARLVLSVLSKAANKSQGAIRARCANCDYEGAPQSRFCGQCGAQLLESQMTHQTEPPVETKAAPEPVPQLGDSFLPRVAAEPESSFVYSFEDRVNIFHWGRTLVLIALLGCVAAAASYWYRDLRDVASRLSRRESTPAPIVRPATGTATPNNRTPTDHKIRSLADDIREKPLPKPSAGIPLDSVPRATQRRVRIISGVRRAATGTRKLAHNNHRRASGPVQAGAVVPAGSSATDAPPGESLHDSESQTARDAQNVMDEDQETPSNRNIQSPADGVGGKGAAVATRHYVPRPPPGFGTSNIASRTGHKVPRPPPEGAAAPNGPDADESGSDDASYKDRQIPMNRVPRPPQR